ncbi:MAG: hypothetical protein AAF514_05515 [Verrucomicrobiota bacterium]
MRRSKEISAARTHDGSKYFSDRPTGFHLKEWTYQDLQERAEQAGFTGLIGIRNLRFFSFRAPFSWFCHFERFLRAMPGSVQRFLSARMLPRLVVELIW